MNVKKYRLEIFIIAISIFFISCSRKNEKKNSETYKYYKINFRGDTTGFVERKVFYKDSLRIDSIDYFSKNQKLEFSNVEEYIILNNGLKNKHSNKFFLRTDKKECYNYTDFYGFKMEVCYLGKKDLKLSSLFKKDVYHFELNLLSGEVLVRDLYFDKNYILLKDQLRYGFAPNTSFMIYDYNH